MRLFVAVFPPPDAVDHLAAVVDSLAVGRARARVTPSERWHLTLAFLGEVPDESAGPAALAVSAVEGPVGELRIRGGGKFGHGRSTVLWAGVEGDVEGLTRVGRAVRRELRARRLHPDDKRFAPHLTVARPGDRISHPDLTADLATLRDYTGPAWPVTELVLVRSMLGPNPSYTPLAHHPV
ncbi:RNA 2',3'-cyclic phosphodiesterase [Catellatospora chokoriensis]|uniref:RNA 2',3'-cyclic phosphodiesterase n=1 Tax=Catellatospora chokoriensis TaxID=310353 RepID=A0A8J3K2B4_9ACTN|nr:RNA 2',3'-cyclic phosphodiesterase [Catellatospora chokoriensis]GIF89118.1 RNA 2',3'-cyclic phosphodiesterase [Catellatospora chokoriensis]